MTSIMIKNENSLTAFNKLLSFLGVWPHHKDQPTLL